MNKAQAFREAGRVKRFHANVVTHPQTVGEHSWNMVMLLRALHPNPSKELIWAVLTHDIHERWTGDIPGPAKWWLNETFKQGCHEIETDVNRMLDLNIALTDSERSWLNALDALEGWMFALDELAQGNRHVEHVVRAYQERFDEQRDSLPEPILRFIEEYEWRRQPDVF